MTGIERARHHFKRGENCALLERWEDALVAYEKAVEAHGDYPEAWSRRGVALRNLGELEEALANFDEALRLKPDYVEAHDHQANVLRCLNRDAEALAAADAALRLDSACFAAMNTRGHALRALGRIDEALESYHRAVEACPGNGPSRFNRGACLLLNGEFEKGWPDYEYRWRSADLDRMASIVNQSLWKGEDLVGKSILLHAEQGLGDAIQFCRYASMVADLGAKVVLAAPPQLRGLMASLRGVSEFTSRVDFTHRYDFQCPLLSLPLAFGTRLETIPSPTPYLSVPESYRAKWRQRLGSRRAPRIGLAWAGNPDHVSDRQRSITLELAQRLAPAECDVYCLQYSIPPRDVPALALFPKLRFFGSEIADFLDTAALIQEMDLVISVDTAILHLAGALDVPVWGLLAFASDWRWLLDRAESPWYPTLRLFRQPVQGQWEPVVDAVRQAAAGFAHRQLAQQES